MTKKAVTAESRMPHVAFLLCNKNGLFLLLHSSHNEKCFSHIYAIVPGNAHTIFDLSNKKRYNMRKGILVVMVLAAWVLLRNQTYTQLFVSKQHNVKQTARLVAKTISNDLFQFTSVHLLTPEMKIKKRIQIKQACILHAANEKQHMNHETLLLINSL